jgi:hypothetical protein
LLEEEVHGNLFCTTQFCDPDQPLGEKRSHGIFSASTREQVCGWG